MRRSPPKSKYPSQMWTSLRQIPAASTRSSTSSPAGSGSGYSRASSGFPHSMICIARMSATSVPNQIRGAVAPAPFRSNLALRSDHLVAQLRFAALQSLEILAQDLDHIVFVCSRLARGVGGEEHLLHAP